MDQVRTRVGHAWKGLTRIAGSIALATSVAAGAANAAQYVPTAAITLPGNANSTSFDIGYVDTTIGTYYLASRDVAGIVAVNTSTLAATTFGAGQFQGIKASNLSGPNGVITVGHNEVWGGDGNGQIRVYNATTGAFITTIEPGINGPGPVPQNRADEACWDPSHNVVVWAWDEPVDNFIAFINPTTHQVISTIKMDGAPGDGPNATNGIEQCQWDARTNLIYLNLPEVNGNGTDSVSNGGVVVLNGANAASGAGAIVTTWSIPVANCNGNQGMAIGPRREIALSCSRSSVTNKGNGSVIVSDLSGAVIATLPSVWGGDEMYYDARSGHYAFSGSNNSPPTLSFVQTTAPPASVDQAFPQAASEHSVAADYVHGQIFFPVVNAAAAQAQKYCSSVGGSDTLGCILVLTYK